MYSITICLLRYVRMYSIMIGDMLVKVCLYDTNGNMTDICMSISHCGDKVYRQNYYLSMEYTVSAHNNIRLMVMTI